MFKPKLTAVYGILRLSCRIIRLTSLQRRKYFVVGRTEIILRWTTGRAKCSSVGNTYAALLRMTSTGTKGGQMKVAQGKCANTRLRMRNKLRKSQFSVAMDTSHGRVAQSHHFTTLRCLPNQDPKDAGYTTT